MQNELINQGLTLMLAGMGTVFVFLTILATGMMLMSRLVGLSQVATPAADPSDDEVAAISAAIVRHRTR